MNDSLVIIIFGRSGSGKGAQAKLLLEIFKIFFYISSGDLFRNMAAQDTLVGEKFKKIQENGSLPPDDIFTALWMHEFAFKFKKENSIIFEGMPRRVEEAKNLDRFLEFLELNENMKVFLLDVSRQEAFNRLIKRGRKDDTPESINNRLDYFEQSVVKAIDYYKSQDRLITINGEQTIEKVHEDILKALNRE